MSVINSTLRKTPSGNQPVTSVARRTDRGRVPKGLRGRDEWHAGRSSALSQDARNTARGRPLEARPAGPVGQNDRLIWSAICTNAASRSSQVLPAHSTPARRLAGFLPCHGQPGRDRARTGGRVHPCWTGSPRAARPQRRAQVEMTASKIDLARTLLTSGMPPKDVELGGLLSTLSMFRLLRRPKFDVVFEVIAAPLQRRRIHHAPLRYHRLTAGSEFRAHTCLSSPLFRLTSFGALKLRTFY